MATVDRDTVDVESTYIPDTTLHRLNGEYVVRLAVSPRGWIWMSSDEADEIADRIKACAIHARSYVSFDDFDDEQTVAPVAPVAPDHGLREAIKSSLIHVVGVAAEDCTTAVLSVLAERGVR